MSPSSQPRRHARRSGVVVTAAVCCSVLLLVACGNADTSGAGDSASGSDATTVLASTSIWADVTAHVACDRLDVPTLIPVGTDAHSFEPTVQDADMLRSARLVVVNGLGLEEGLQDSLHTADAAGATVLAVGPELSPLGSPDDRGPEDGESDPHVWMDPDRVARAVPLIAAALADVDGLPVAPDELQRYADEYVAELHQLSAEMDSTLAFVPAAQRKLVTNHESLAYFADRFDFEVIGAAIPSTSSLGESNPRALDELASTIREQDVTTIFAETTAPTQLSEALAAQVGRSVEVVELFTESLGGPGSGAETYVDMMRTDAGLVAAALGTDAAKQRHAVTSVLALAPVEWLIDPFTQSVTMQRALAAGTLAAIACGLVGTWVVLRGMTFIGDALAHGVLPGLAIATIVGFNPTIGALASAGVMVGGITVIGRRSRLAEDTTIGLLFVGMLALGVLIVSRSRSFAGDLTGFLFGGITSVTTGDLVLGAVVAGLALLTVVVGYRSFLVLCFNPGAAKLLGLRPGLTHAVLLLLVTLTVVASFKTVGSLLVFALITAPAASAVQLVRRVPWVLVTSVVFAEISVVAGLLLSWHARLAAGAAMATSAVGIFILALVVSEVTRLVRSRRSVEAAPAGP